MPKTNHAGATYYGHEGVVEDANGKLSQLDSSRNLDGSVVDGFESEDREPSDEEAPEVQQADPTGVSTVDREDEEEPAPKKHVTNRRR